MRLLSFRLCTRLEHLFLTVSMGLPNLSPTVIGSVLAGGVLDVSMLLQKKTCCGEHAVIHWVNRPTGVAVSSYSALPLAMEFSPFLSVAETHMS
jgi:hypothetical protein